MGVRPAVRRTLNYSAIKVKGSMVFNDTFNNISVISWRSVLLLEETKVPGENHRLAATHRQSLLHNVVGRFFTDSDNVSESFVSIYFYRNINLIWKRLNQATLKFQSQSYFII
jgi:hypothetical protein